MLLTNHFQNAYVTADIEHAATVLHEQFGVVRRPRCMDVVQQMTTPRGAREAALRMAFVQIGDLQYELIQPVSGDIAFYVEALRPDRLLQLHHVAMRTEDLGVVRAESEAHGRQVVAEGQAGELRYIHVDARQTLGHYLEYVCAPAAFWDSLRGR